MTVRKKYLWQHPHGRWYVRKSVNGKLIYLGAITAQEGTADFDQQYWEIMSGKRAKEKTSWAALIAAMRETDKWANYAPRYRKDLELVFEYLTEKIGKADVARLTQADIYDAM